MIWALQAEKAGDNAQMDTLLEAVGLPVTVKRLRMRRRWQRGKPRIRAGLGHLDRAASDALEPPWPDLVVLSGRRLMNVALWLREQSRGRTRLVLVGRPHGHYEAFDLIVAAPQFRLPARANVINLELPLIVPPLAAIERGGAALAGRIRGTGPAADRRAGRRPDAAVSLRCREARDADRPHAGRDGRRRHLVREHQPAYPDRRWSTRWPRRCRPVRGCSAGRPRPPDNPYLALLALADRFVVTGDSASMLVEVARLGRPLADFRAAGRSHGLRRLLRARPGVLSCARHGARSAI